MSPPGLAATEPELQDVMQTLRATKWEILWNIGLPRTMPYFFASLKVAATLAFVGAVISETVASNRGIGNLMMIASSSFDVPLVFAGLFILAALGVALYAGLLADRGPRHRLGGAQRQFCGRRLAENFHTDIGGSQCIDRRRQMRPVARLDDDLENHRLGRQVGENPLVRDFDDVRARIAQDRDDRGKLTRPVDDVEVQPRQPALARELAGQHT